MPAPMKLTRQAVTMVSFDKWWTKRLQAAIRQRSHLFQHGRRPNSLHKTCTHTQTQAEHFDCAITNYSCSHTRQAQLEHLAKNAPNFQSNNTPNIHASTWGGHRCFPSQWICSNHRATSVAACRSRMLSMLVWRKWPRAHGRASHRCLDASELTPAVPTRASATYDAPPMKWAMHPRCRSALFPPVASWLCPRLADDLTGHSPDVDWALMFFSGKLCRRRRK